MKTQAALFIIVLAGFAAALTTTHVPAVDSSGNGLVTTFDAKVIDGNGSIFVSIDPLVSVDTQASERLAVRIAAQKAGVNASRYDVLFKINSNAEIVDGPSGGAALTLIAFAEFSKRKPRSDIAVSGTIERDGSIGQVGGIFEKAKAVSSFGNGRLNVFFIPEGQAVQNGIDLVDYAQQKWGLQVVEIARIDELLKHAFSAEGSEVNASRQQKPKLDLIEFNATPKTSPLGEIASMEMRESRAALEWLQVAGFLNASSATTVAAKNSLNLSAELLEKGYYYSAANSAFLLALNLEQLKLSNSSTSALKKLVQKLSADLESRKSAEPTAENLDWFISSKLRHFWAAQRLDELEESAPLAPAEVVAGQYATAKSWSDASLALNGFASQSGEGSRLNQLAFRDLASRRLDEATTLEGQGLLDSESATHLVAARRAFSEGDYLSSAFDSSFPLAFTRALENSSEKLLPEIFSDLCGSESFDAACFGRLASRSDSRSAWAELYYAHGLYSLQEANRSDDIDSALNALKLFELGAEIDSLYAEFDSVSATAPPIATPDAGQQPLPPQDDAEFAVEVSSTPSPDGLRDFALFTVVAIAAILLIVGVALATRPRDLAASREEEYAERMDRAEKMLLEGRLSEKNYDHLKRKYSEAVRRLEKGGPAKKASANPEATRELESGEAEKRESREKIKPLKKSSIRKTAHSANSRNGRRRR